MGTLLSLLKKMSYKTNTQGPSMAKKKKKKAAHRPSPSDMGNVSSLLAYLKKNTRTRPALKKGGKQTAVQAT